MNKSKRLNKTQFDIQSNQYIYYQVFNRLKKHLFIYFILFFWWCPVFIAAYGLSLVAVSRDYSLVMVHRLLIAVANLVAEHRLLGARASVVAAHRLSCSLSCRIFPDTGLNPRPLHWQLDSITGPPDKSSLSNF